MRPSLKSICVQKLSLYIDLILNDDQIAQIRKVAEPDKDGDSNFRDTYIIDRARHRAWAWVVERDKKERKFEIQIYYEPKGGGRLHRNLPRVSQLIDILSSNKEELDINCQADFEFLRRYRAKPIINLPIRCLNLPNMPFDEISGLSFVKRGIGQQEEYTVVLGMSGRGVFWEIIFFNYRSRIHETIVDDIVSQAKRISDCFIVKE
jgi:hypothetical protein